MSPPVLKRKDGDSARPDFSVGPGDNLTVRLMHFSLLVSPKRLAKKFLAVAFDPLMALPTSQAI